MTTKEKFEEAKRLYETANADQRYVLESLFPELKESEDERIRKELIKFVKSRGGFKQEYIAWLEKQKKPIDKVEPKFHEGEWITNGDYTWQIVSVTDLDYTLQSQNGNIVDDTISHVDEYFHSFSIQDAKDGDVLHCWIDGDEFILIYKGIKDGYITTYGHLYQRFKLFAEEPTTMFCRTIQGHFTPATKEQCDLLFSKMKEAGYMWDTEKKELKKIKQKSVDKVEPKKLKKTKFKPGDRIIGIVSGMQYYITKVCDDYYCTESGCIIMFCAQENFELYKQKPAWSEEDESKIRHLIAFLDTNPNSVIYSRPKEEWIDWLKSLRHRLQWKPSDEQMKALEESIMFLGTSWVSARQFALESLYQDLKKLRDE